MHPSLLPFTPFRNPDPNLASPCRGGGRGPCSELPWGGCHRRRRVAPSPSLQRFPSDGTELGPHRLCSG